MSLSIKERIALVKRAAEIHKAMQGVELKLTERIKLGKEKISVRRQLGFDTKKAEPQKSASGGAENKPALDIEQLSHASKEDVISGKIAGVRYVEGESYDAEAGISSGVVNLTDKFFAHEPDVRRSVLSHELAHYDTAALYSADKALLWDMTDAGYLGERWSNGGGIEGINGQFKPDESLTEGFSLYQNGGDDAQALKAKYPMVYRVAESYYSTGGIDATLRAEIKAKADEVRAADRQANEAAEREVQEAIKQLRVISDALPDGAQKDEVNAEMWVMLSESKVTDKARELIAAGVPVELPEMVRKLRDGELATGSGKIIGETIVEAEPYLSLSECVERAKEWAQKSGAVAA